MDSAMRSPAEAQDCNGILVVEDGQNQTGNLTPNSDEDGELQRALFLSCLPSDVFDEQVEDLIRQQEPREDAIADNREVVWRDRLLEDGNSLFYRFKQLGELADINKAKDMFEQAVSLTPDGHADKPGMLNNLGISLKSRFERLGDLMDIDYSIEVMRQAVSLTPEGHADKAKPLGNLGNSLRSRFEWLGDLRDIDNSIEVTRQAVSLTPDGHADMPGQLNNLGSSLSRRFERLGDLRDIDNSIEVTRQAVSSTPDGHANKPILLSNLGNSLLSRFGRLGDLMDIDNSIEVMRQAVSLTPDGQPNKPTRLSNLGNSLRSRFERLGELMDIDNSIEVKRQAVSLTPDGHTDRPIRLSNLGNSLLSRFERLGDLMDIDYSIEVMRQAVSLTPDWHAEKPTLLNNLGNSLQSRFERLGKLMDIDNSIEVMRQAVSLTPDGHADRPMRLSNLGSSLSRRFERLGDQTDIDNAIEYFRLAALSRTGNPQVRLRASLLWADTSGCLRGDDELHAYQVFIDLLPQVAWLGAPIRHRYHSVKEVISNHGNKAASAAIEAGNYKQAAEWLEQCRSIVWSQLMNLRTPLDDLRTVNEALACELERVSQQLEIAGLGNHLEKSSSYSESSLEQQASTHRRLAEKREELITRVRTIPGFEQFLKPKKFSVLSEVAQSHPVILINISQLQCDALVLAPSKSVIHTVASLTKHNLSRHKST